MPETLSLFLCAARAFQKVSCRSARFLNNCFFPGDVSLFHDDRAVTDYGVDTGTLSAVNPVGDEVVARGKARGIIGADKEGVSGGSRPH